MDFTPRPAILKVSLPYPHSFLWLFTFNAMLPSCGYWLKELFAKLRGVLLLACRYYLYILLYVVNSLTGKTA